MSWKKGVFLVIILFFITVSSGVIYLYNAMPDSLKENSQLKMYCSKKPFEVRVETAGYNIYLLNGKFFEGVKEGTVTTFNKLVEDVKSAAGKLTKSKNKNAKENNSTENNDMNNNEDTSNNSLDNSDVDNTSIDNTDLNNNSLNIEDNNINNDIIDNNDNNGD